MCLLSEQGQHATADPETMSNAGASKGATPDERLPSRSSVSQEADEKGEQQDLEPRAKRARPAVVHRDADRRSEADLFPACAVASNAADKPDATATAAASTAASALPHRETADMQIVPPDRRGSQDAQADAPLRLRQAGALSPV